MPEAPVRAGREATDAQVGQVAGGQAVVGREERNEGLWRGTSRREAAASKGGRAVTGRAQVPDHKKKAC